MVASVGDAHLLILSAIVMALSVCPNKSWGETLITSRQKESKSLLAVPHSWRVTGGLQLTLPMEGSHENNGDLRALEGDRYRS